MPTSRARPACGRGTAPPRSAQPTALRPKGLQLSVALPDPLVLNPADPNGPPEAWSVQRNFERLALELDARVRRDRFWLNVKDFGARGDGSTDDSAAIQAALDHLGNATTGERAIYIPGGSYIIGTPLVPYSEQVWFGDGPLVTILRKKSGVNTPIVDKTDAIFRWHPRDIGFGTQSQASHGANEFPLVRVSAYYSVFINVWFYYSPGDGAEIGGIIAPAVAGDSDRFFACAAVGNYGHGFNLTDNLNFAMYACGVEYNGKTGIYVGRSQGQYFQGLIDGTRFESNEEYAIYLANCQGVSITNNRILNSPVGLDKDCSGNVVQHNLLMNSRIHDGGFENVIGPNTGEPSRPHPELPPRRLYPASRAKDQDFSSRTTAYWTSVGGATTIRDDRGGATAMRELSRVGRIPLGLAGAAGKGGYQDIIEVVADETYLVEVFWWSGVSGVTIARAKVELIDQATSTVLHDSGNISRPGGDDAGNTEWIDARYSTVFQVPAGVTTLRVQVTSPDAGTLYLSACDVVKLPVLNGGFEGTYAGGLAPNWTAQSGTGTPTEETTIRYSGSKAQKLVVTAGNGYTLGQDVSSALIEGNLYLLRGSIYVSSGDPTRAILAFGSTNITRTTTQEPSYRTARRNNAWDTVTAIFRPSTFTRVLCGIASDASAGATAYFDDIALIPLREATAPRHTTSKTLDLSGGAQTDVVLTPPHDQRLRRAHVIYTEASSADAGVAVRVGTGATAAFNATLTSEVSKAQWSQTEMTLTRHDLRAGAPVVVSTPGGKVGAGEVQVVLEYE